MSNTYKYSELLDDEIRLLDLWPGEGNSDLEGKFDTYKLEVDDTAFSFGQSHAPIRQGPEPPVADRYEALSYTWGTEEPRSYIKIWENSVPFIIYIKSNLEAALRTFRHSKRRRHPQLFWIDALCIDQDNHDEKSAQIRKMAEIYNQADRVRVWLGNASEDSDVAIKFIGRLLNLDVFDELTRDPVSDMEWAAFRNLMRRPWFNRRWIVQEIGLAREARVYCGPEWVSWQDFAEAISLFAKADLPLNKLFQQSKKFGHHPDFLGEVDALGAKGLVDTANNLFRKSDDGTILEHLRSLEGLMSTLTVFEASDPRDTVYAILWLAHDARPGAKGMAALNDPRLHRTPSPGTPDTDPRTPLAGSPQSGGSDNNGSHIFSFDSPNTIRNNFSTASRMAHSQPNPTYPRLQMFESTLGKSLRPPTLSLRTGKLRKRAKDSSLRRAEQEFELDPEPIIVDYSLSVYEVYRQFLEFVIKRSRSLDIICRPWAPPPLPAKPGAAHPKPEGPLPSWIPSLAGKAFGLRPVDRVYNRIAADALVGTPGLGPRSYNTCGKTRAFWGQKELITDTRTLLVRGFVVEALDQVRAPATQGYIPPSWLELAGWHHQPSTHTQDLDASPPPEEFWRTLVADRALDGHTPPPPYFRGACKWAFSRRIDGQGLDTRDLLMHGEPNPIAREFLRRVQAVVWERCLVLSESSAGDGDGFLGLAPRTAQPGDLICILYGCSVPVLLRRREVGRRSNGGGNSGNSSNSKRKRTDRGGARKSSRLRSSPAGRTGSGGGSSSRGARATQRSRRRSESLGTSAEEGTPEAEPSADAEKAAADFAPAGPDIVVPNEYTLVGECYVHGMMSGEGFKHQAETGAEVQEFRLV